MLNNVLDDLKRDRAKFTREVEYLKETAIDDVIDERIEAGEELFARESYNELVEAKDLLDKLTTDDEVLAESVEVERIMTATENISFDEMIGIN